MLSLFRPLMLATLLPFGTLAEAQIAQPPVGYEQEAANARALLQNAVTYYKEHGDAALPAFSRQGEFITGDLYVYVVSSDGIMLASGGPSIRLIGRDVSNVLKSDEENLFNKALKNPEGQIFEGEYRWSSWNTTKEIRKHAYYERVGDRIIVVGYYLPRSTPDEARALLDKASQAFSHNPEQAIEKINTLAPDFYQDDLYVLAVNLENERIVAHGYNKRLINTNFNALRSSDNQTIGTKMLETLKSQSNAEISYAWRNPVTGKAEPKTTYIRKVGSYLVAVGYYSK